MRMKESKNFFIIFYWRIRIVIFKFIFFRNREFKHRKENISMPSSEIADYVREQIRAGYSRQEIETELANQGWSQVDINAAFTGAREPQGQINPPVVIKKRTGNGAFVSLVGGILIFIFSMENILSLPLISVFFVDAGLALDFLAVFSLLLADIFLVGVISLLFGIVIIIGSLVMNHPGKKKIGAIVVLVFSVITIIGFPGFLPIVGGILGIIGSILEIRSNPFPSTPSQAYPSPSPPGRIAGA